MLRAVNTEFSSTGHLIVPSRALRLVPFGTGKVQILVFSLLNLEVQHGA